MDTVDDRLSQFKPSSISREHMLFCVVTWERVLFSGNKPMYQTRFF